MYRPLARVLKVCACIVLVCLSAAAQENNLRVEFTETPAKNGAVALLRHGGFLYASVDDIAKVFGLTTTLDAKRGKLAVASSPRRLLFTPDNPFVVTTDGERHQSVYQLSGPVILKGEAFFVPLRSFLAAFTPLFTRGTAWNEQTLVLRVGAGARNEEPPQFDIAMPQFEQKANGILVCIPAKKPLKNYDVWLRDDGWLYVTLPGVQADTTALNAMPPSGRLREVVAVQSPTSLQLTFRLSGNYADAQVMPNMSSDDLLISVRSRSAEEMQAEKKQKEMQNDLISQRKRWQMDVIVLDAGHGGADPGTIGVTGVREKDVTLGITLKLGNLIRKRMKGVEVVYTRKTDRFVELDRRGQIANAADGKLFISIHCNAMKKKPSATRGYEVYLLRPGRTTEAIAIAERENAVITMEEGYEKRYKELTEENFILVTMAQSAYVKWSEVFADITQQEMYAVTGIPNRGVRQAGFYVLVGAAMPNVLVETAYLSNRQDERFLKSEAGQMKIAESLYRAVKRYRQEYEKVLQEGTELGSK